jgi:hypothetical protein
MSIHSCEGSTEKFLLAVYDFQLLQWNSLGDWSTK